MGFGKRTGLVERYIDLHKKLELITSSKLHLHEFQLSGSRSFLYIFIYGIVVLLLR